MLYIIRIGDYTQLKETYYYMFETYTESILSGNDDFLIKILSKYNGKVKNCRLNNRKIELNPWPHKLMSTSEIESRKKREVSTEYILLTQLAEQKFKLVNWKGLITYVTAEELKYFIRLGKIANCTTEVKHDTVYKSIDTYDTHSDDIFERYITSKYKEYRAKVLLLGLDISFEYVIEGASVKLVNYTGSSTTVILPSFISAINKRAFANEGITQLKLSEGLKYIGNEAFIGNDIESVEIPKSVEFIGRKAFVLNKRLTHNIIQRDQDTFKLLNKSTLIIDTIYY